MKANLHVVHFKDSKRSSNSIRQIDLPDGFNALSSEQKEKTLWTFVGEDEAWTHCTKV